MALGAQRCHVLQIVLLAEGYTTPMAAQTAAGMVAKHAVSEVH